MAVKNENETFATTLNAKLEKSKGVVFAITAIVLVVIIAVVVFAILKSQAIEKGIAQFESISYSLTKDAAGLSAEDITARQNKALEDLAPLSEKKGAVGLRANMLIAEIKFAQKNYAEAREAWLKAVEAKSNNYTTSQCYYNAAVCSEELGDADSAISYYKSASEDEDFLLIDHALFSLGRVNETSQKYDDAKAAYEKLFNLHSSSSWGELAKSRLIALKASGLIQ